MPVHVINEANRCLQCKNPRCRMEGCPIRTNIPEVIRLFKENRMMEAAEILFQNNPLSVVCSLVCNHEGQCEGRCVRGIKGEPVHFSSIENYISDSCFERLDLSCAPSNGMKVGVIGAGPAGITIAIILARTARRSEESSATAFRSSGFPSPFWTATTAGCATWALCFALTSNWAAPPAFRTFLTTAIAAFSWGPAHGSRASWAYPERPSGMSSTRSTTSTIRMYTSWAIR